MSASVSSRSFETKAWSRHHTPVPPSLSPPLCALAGAALTRNPHSSASSPPQAPEASARRGPGPAVGGDSAPQAPDSRSPGLDLAAGGISAAHAAPSRPFPARPVPLPSRAVPSQNRPWADSQLSSAPPCPAGRGGLRRAEHGKRLGKNRGLSTGTRAPAPPTGARSDPAPRHTARRDWRLPSAAPRQSRSSLFRGGARCTPGGVVHLF